MKFVRSLAFLLALLPGLCFAQVTAKVTGPSEVKPGRLVKLDASTSEGAEVFNWTVIGGQLGPEDVLETDGGKMLAFATDKAGEYCFVLSVAGKDADGKVALSVVAHRLTIGTPLPPVPPTPPVPPVPVSEGFRFIAIGEFDSKVRAGWPADLRVAWESPKSREYLTRKTQRDPDGKTPGWRFWDDDYSDSQLANISKDWQTLYARAKADRAKAGGKDDDPWVLIVNSTAVASQAFPANEAALLELVKKYGGE